MIAFEEKVLNASPLLREKIGHCQRLARDVKIGLVYGELRTRGESYSGAVRLLSERFTISRSTIKRAISLCAPPPWRKVRRNIIRKGF
jgi:hypothetical protein